MNTMKTNKIIEQSIDEMYAESCGKLANWLTPNLVFVDEAMPWADTSVATISGSKIPDGPISEDDLIKAMDKFKEFESPKKWAFIIVADFYKEFKEMLMWPVTTSITKWPTTLFWSPVYKEDSMKVLEMAEKLLKDKFDEVYIVSRKEVYIVNKKFFAADYSFLRKSK